MRYAYALTVEEAEDGVTVTCSDIPEMVTCGATRAEAIARAEDALVSALSFYVEEGRPIPAPSTLSGRDVAVVPMLEAGKLALHDALLEAGMTNVELGRRLGIDEKAARRLRDPLHRSRVAYVEAALRALGRRIVVEVEPVGEVA
ncbi:type II toxin-antitoxin system HicB family antitoxin [Lichenicoccus sp.]|uniref:type II toxin-antitoxin system HicB family antitoxin n=1 Tax=Lichenicoccus sp. TaxID=2781899 RepID=UPI003D0C0B1D